MHITVHMGAVPRFRAVQGGCLRLNRIRLKVCIHRRVACTCAWRSVNVPWRAPETWDPSGYYLTLRARVHLEVHF